MAHIHEKIDFVVSVFIVHDRKVLLIHHKILNSWLPIGGHIELDEDSDTALFREIEEESGLTRNQLHVLTTSAPTMYKEAKGLLTPNYMDIHNYSETHQHLCMIYFLTSSTNKVVLAEKEHHGIKWFSLEDLKTLDLLPQIRFYCEEALRSANENKHT